MPYVIISTQIRIENGPTVVGDADSDPLLMKLLNAEKVQAIGNNFAEYVSPDCPRIILNKLENLGYKVVGTAGIGQTCIWTLYSDTLNAC